LGFGVCATGGVGETGGETDVAGFGASLAIPNALSISSTRPSTSLLTKSDLVIAYVRAPLIAALTKVESFIKVNPGTF